MQEIVPITVYVRCINPSNAGSITAVKITSYTDTTLLTMIDEDIVTAVVNIENIRNLL